ncbi:MAG: hypothetical protein R2708_11100 [Vicinamibacterales bacterium]
MVVTNGRASAARNRLHHRRLDFEEAAGRQMSRIAATVRLRADDAAHVGIDGEIQVALPVARLDVLQAVPLLRQRQEALGQEHQ